MVLRAAIANYAEVLEVVGRNDLAVPGQRLPQRRPAAPPAKLSPQATKSFLLSAGVFSVAKGRNCGGFRLCLPAFFISAGRFCCKSGGEYYIKQKPDFASSE